jgi:geranylgeranyl diphosphate synthase type II
VSTPSDKKQSVQSMVDQFLIDFFESSISKAEAIDSNYGMLWRQLHSLQSAGGKRLRPKLLFMAYDAFGGKDSKLIVPIAAAQELLHFSMLIHDDIIDRDVKRYGVDNINGVYEKIYAPFVTDKANRTHYSNSAAIMAGDLMLAGAHKLITNSTISDNQKINALTILYDSSFDVAGGELLDTESSFRPAGSIDPLKIAKFKTATYSFLGPLLTGAVLADSNENTQKNLHAFSINLGIAYQLTDDLLGVFGDETKTGKSSTGDIREGKQTYLISAATSRLTKTSLKQFEKYFGKPNISDSDINTVKRLIIESGARHITEKLIDSYVEKATSTLMLIEMTDSSRNKFLELITKATKRDY